MGGGQEGAADWRCGGAGGRNTFYMSFVAGLTRGQKNAPCADRAHGRRRRGRGGGGGGGRGKGVVKGGSAGSTNAVLLVGWDGG